MKENLKNILFLDIETVSQYKTYEELDPKWQQLWDKKAKYIIKNEQTSADVYDRASIYAEFGKIVCISVGLLFQNENNQWCIKLKSFYGHNEHELLEEFCELVNNNFYTEHHYLCGHNGKEFDFPYISRRLLVNALPVPSILNSAGKKPWEIRHYDTMELWKFGDYKHFTSLDLMAAIFNIPTPKDVIDGSMVGGVYWQENNLEKIAEYCQKDVSTLINVFLRLNSIATVPAERIFNS